ncbi:MAG: hypothetical protein ACFFC7_02905 [Candidatus Hermodarchaeota archaeon]
MWNALLKGEIVFAEDLNEDERRSDNFKCLGCGKKVIYVHGSDRASHFRHFPGEGFGCPLVELKEDHVSVKEAQNFRMLRDIIASHIFGQVTQVYPKSELKYGKIRVSIATTPSEEEILDLRVLAGYASEVAIRKITERVAAVPFHHLVWIIAIPWSLKDIISFNFGRTKIMPQTNRSVFEYVRGVQPLLISPNGEKFFIYHKHWQKIYLDEILSKKKPNLFRGRKLNLLTLKDLTYSLKKEPPLRKWLPKNKVIWLKREKTGWFTRQDMPIPLQLLAMKPAANLPEILHSNLRKDKQGRFWLLPPFSDNQYQVLREIPAFHKVCVYEKEGQYAFFATSSFETKTKPVILKKETDQEWKTKNQAVDLLEKLGWLETEDFQVIAPCLEKKEGKWYLQHILMTTDVQRLMKVFSSLKIRDDLLLFPSEN